MGNVVRFRATREMKTGKTAVREPRPVYARRLDVRLPGLKKAIEASGGQLTTKMFGDLFGYWNNWLSRTQNWETQPTLEQTIIMCAKAGISVCQALGLDSCCPPVSKEYAADRHRRERKSRKNDWKGSW